MSRRTQRINELLRQELSWLLAKDMNDPRLPVLVTITMVDVSSDLRYAKVYVSVMGNNDERRIAVEMLQSATGFLHRELKSRLALRYVPQLSFFKDDSIALGTRMLQIMDNLQQQ